MPHQLEWLTPREARLSRQVEALERDNAWLWGKLALATSLLRTAGEVAPELAGLEKMVLDRRAPRAVESPRHSAQYSTAGREGDAVT